MKKDFKFLKWNGNRAVALLSLTIILSLLTIGGTLAYIFVETGILASIFAPAKVEVSIIGNEIINKSEIPVYARAAIVVSWVKDGVTLSDKPLEGTDYAISINGGWEQGSDGWERGSDGYWYHIGQVASGESVELIASVNTATAPEGCELVIEILSSVIQATPKNAVEDSWGLTVNDDGTLNVN